MREKFGQWLKSEGWILVVASGVYFIWRLWQLGQIAIFADEAIYLRWSQLIMTEPQRYAFFPLNDGKTPLQMWLNIPLLMLIKDPLIAGRVLSVVAGWGQMIVVWLILGKLKCGKKTQVMVLVMSIVLPWWWFNQRLALIDGLLTFWFSLLIYFLLDISIKNEWQIKKLVAATVCFGLALWTKVPAILFLPTIFLLVFRITDWRRSLVKIGVIAGGGLAMLGGLKLLSPAFGQLFARSGDFLSFTGVKGMLENVLIHGGEFINMNNKYLTYGLMALLLVEMVYMVVKKNRQWWLLMLSSAGFFMPIILWGGGMTYARYYLPSILPLMIAILVGMDEIWREKKWKLGRVAIIGCLGVMVVQSGIFIVNSEVNLAKLDLEKMDKVQYLEEWSSGFGIKEVLAAAEKKASADNKILLMSEGSFGTPTDALNLYLAAEKNTNIAVEGIGWQVFNIPQTALDRAEREYDEAWLVVNSHRMLMEMPREKLLMEIKRPEENAPTLQVWKIR